jgi:hypothetical protein
MVIESSKNNQGGLSPKQEAQGISANSTRVIFRVLQLDQRRESATTMPGDPKPRDAELVKIVQRLWVIC